MGPQQHHPLVGRRPPHRVRGGFSQDRGLLGTEDYNLWLRLAHAGYSFDFLPAVMMEYMPTPASLTANESKFALAEVCNIEDLLHRGLVSPDAAHRKLMAVCAEYGRNLLYARDLAGARRLLSVPLREDPTLEVAKLWAATWLPVWLLNWRRRMA